MTQLWIGRHVALPESADVSAHSKSRRDCFAANQLSYSQFALDPSSEFHQEIRREIHPIPSEMSEYQHYHFQTGKPILRPATGSDAPTLRRWESAPHLAGLLGDGDWEWESALSSPHPAHRPFMVEVDRRVVGFLEILDPALDPERYWGDLPPGFRAVDLWIGEAAYLGKGVGSAMMRQALDICFADPEVHTVLVDPLASNADAHRFYERCGFTFLERRQFDEDDCLVFQIVREVWAKGEAKLSS